MENHYQRLLAEVEVRVSRLRVQDLEEYLQTLGLSLYKAGQYRDKLFKLQSSKLPSFILQNFRNKIYKGQRHWLKVLEAFLYDYH